MNVLDRILANYYGKNRDISEATSATEIILNF